MQYNSDSKNTDWSPTQNCAGYASGIWKKITGEEVTGGGSVMIPADVENWIIKLQ